MPSQQTSPQMTGRTSEAVVLVHMARRRFLGTDHGVLASASQNVTRTHIMTQERSECLGRAFQISAVQIPDHLLYGISWVPRMEESNVWAADPASPGERGKSVCSMNRAGVGESRGV